MSDSASFLEQYANWHSSQRLFITFDVDWAPDYMLRHVLSLLESYPVGVTFFATHLTPLLQEVARGGRHEVGIHPNLQPRSSQGTNTEEILDTLTGWYPDAHGCRFHVLGFSYRDLMKLAGRGMRYDVSRLMYNTSHLQPAYHKDLDLTLFPYMWEDGICENSGEEVSTASMALDTPGLKILNFHPMNIFINGPTADARLEFISKAGPLLECPEEIARAHRRTGSTGAQCALEGLLEYAGQKRIVIQPLRELERAFSEARAGAR